MSFDHEFAKEDEDYLIKRVQEFRGCFNIQCGAPSASKRCTKCGVAVYCSRECQIKDWKDPRCPHKEICKVYAKDTSPDMRPEGNGQKGAVAIALLGVGLIGEEICSKALMDRTDSFFEEVKRCMDIAKQDDKYGFRSANMAIGIAAGCIYDLEKVRLVCAATTHSENGPVTVNHVVFEAIGDGGDEVRRLLHPPCGSGDIPEDSRDRVLETLKAFVRRSNEKFGVQIQGITYGRGLRWLGDEEYADAKKELNSFNGKVHGVEKTIIWMRDMSYAMEDVQNSFMSGLFGK